MKIAVQLFGMINNMNNNLNDLLYYIDFTNQHIQFDFYILTEKNKELQNLIKVLNKNNSNIIILKFVEDINLNEENVLIENYYNSYNNFIKKYKNENYINNNFVSKLWYRRYILNNMRLNYEKEKNIKYDFIVRSRFDLGFKKNIKIDNDIKFNYKCNIICPDILSICNDQIINEESNLGLNILSNLKYYYDNNLNYLENCENIELISEKWLFMSESNLMTHLKFNISQNYKIINPFQFYLEIQYKNGESKYF